MAMTASARRVGDGLEHEVLVNGRHTITTDEPERLGGTDRGPAPHELLAAALASCVATMVAAYAINRGWEIGPSRRGGQLRPRQLPSAGRRRGSTCRTRCRPISAARLERVAATCPYRRALEGDFSFEEQTVYEPLGTAVA